MKRCEGHSARSVSPALGVLAALFCSAAAGAISLVGQLDPNDPQDAFLYEFTLSDPTTVAIQSWGFGGTLNAPGGTNAQGALIPAGGFDPYLSVFSGSGPTATLLAANDDGICPPGALSAGFCRDSALSLPALPAGTYTLALTSFLNMSFAENHGSGTLADGFVGLGSFGGRTNDFAVDISGTNLLMPTLALGHIPNALTFGAQTLNLPSGPLAVLITNIGAAPVALGSLSVAGANATEFTTAGNCTGTLGVAASCVINVIFTPTGVGSRSALLTLNSNASASPAINLHGTGTNSAVASATVTTTDLDFGTILVGNPSTQVLVVSNSGAAPLVIGLNDTAGNNPGDFVVTDNCAGQTLTTGEMCTLTVVFTPTVPGQRSATLTINSNASNDPVTVALRGIGGSVLDIPTLHEWGLLALALLLMMIGTVFTRHSPSGSPLVKATDRNWERRVP